MKIRISIYPLQGSQKSHYAIGAFGKSNLDRVLNRNIKSEKSSYLGVKYHVRTDFAFDTVTLQL